ncbi:hypothetical protein [Litorivivens sp.]|uniref:hypothetical protein n=1 Tax=Litorivivens sp. TaxID=2020868 RepID=UPI003564EA2B
MNAEKYKELKEYCEKMKQRYADRAAQYRAHGRSGEADKEQGLSDYCDQLLKRMAV